MFIGVPKEIKTDEYRVGLTPATVEELTTRGHRVVVETVAGAGAGIADQEYIAAGAEIATSADQIFQRAELIVKVKEPLASEREQLRRGQIIFTYLHLAPDPEQTHDLMASGVTALAYETVTDAAGKLPLLAPMSRVAGRMAPQVAAHFLQRPQGGRGILLGGIDGLPPASILVLGGGVVGSNAAEMAIGMGAKVSIAARTPETLRQLSQRFGDGVTTVTSDAEAIEALCSSADVVIGAALVAGAAAPKLIPARTVAAMKPGSVIVDVSIDQGGCAETSRPTTHSQPTFLIGGVVHYCVPNMPGAVPRTSAYALDNATRPFVLALADKGFPRALIDNPHLRNGLNVHDGKVTCRAVADALRLPFTAAIDVLH
ncbi:alanine dehydrogenase [Bradyrhizobium sediminis]|uniref:Alanine dehydrogenase n=1 Tax=Bradyrhizobium sediminis TaxID=2840469 RepID=A0A975NDC2_9BRAD|nr:alanine dehydrogenase [Bradyrhizobium sediminis]QWG12094.1 alanine dehydrogenase [Bradyrhizobium sediminis]